MNIINISRFDFPAELVLPAGCRKFSLSLREMAGVRGIRLRKSRASPSGKRPNEFPRPISSLRSGQMLRGCSRALLVALLGCLFHPASAWACAACYGQSDSPLAAGMNWGILSLLGMIVMVLGGIAAFFIFLAKRSASIAELAGQTEEVTASQTEPN